MSTPSHEVMIIGAGPAGATAAILLARAGRSVTLVDKARFPRDASHLGWLNGRALPILDELKISKKAYRAEPFKKVIFVNEDFAKTATPTFKESPGLVIDRTELNNALITVAVDAGVTLIQGSGVVDIAAMEDSVRAVLSDDSEVDGRLLLMAAGGDAKLLEQLGFTPPSRHARMWTAQIDADLPKGSEASEPTLIVVLGLQRQGSFAMCCQLADRICVSINWLGEKAEAIPKLAQVCQQLHAGGMTPVDLSGDALGAQVTHSPASAALDLETHAGKHSLLIGDAGGFVAATSNEGIYPAMWSAQLAADVILEALKQAHAQDELMTFEQKWRTTMADYLRLPNTDIQFLLPLIFSNQPMADRMGAAFFSGENI